MKPTINLLIQLQELDLIREEEKIKLPGRQLDQLDQSIQAMMGELNPPVRVMYEKLRKKDRVVIVPVSNGGCPVCGMKLPISLVQSVRRAKEIRNCTNCMRILYYPDLLPRNIKYRRRDDTSKVGIARFSSETLMVPRLEAAGCEDVVQILVSKMEQEGYVDRADVLIEKALRRESIVSTAVDRGLAFPHVRGVEGGALTMAVGTSSEGVRFDPGAQKLTHVFFFMVIPTAASAFYLKLLAGLAETFMNAEARKTLLAAKEPDQLWKTLLKTTKSTIK